MNQTTLLTQAQALLGKVISEHTTQRNAEVKSIINKKRQVAPKRMPLGARLAVNTHNIKTRGEKWRKCISVTGSLRGQAQVRPIDKLDEACTNADDWMMLVQHCSADRVMS